MWRIFKKISLPFQSQFVPTCVTTAAVTPVRASFGKHLVPKEEVNREVICSKRLALTSAVLIYSRKLSLKRALVSLAAAGSGSCWMAPRNSPLPPCLINTAHSPTAQYPVFGIDVWEHAYYLKYHNVRVDYLKAIWNFIASRYASGIKS